MPAAPPALVDTYATFPLDIIAAEGSRLKARDGREYWDFYGGHAVALLGHCPPAVVRALTEQAGRLLFYSNVLRLDVRTRAAQRLAEFAGPELGHVFFCNSGAEANENALKLALQHTGRKKIAALAGGWHGRTLLALSATDDAKLRPGLEDLLAPCMRVAPNDPAGLEQIDESIAAVLVEPILSIAGIVELSAGYLQALRSRCTEVGACLIYDEVQTGMGRLGRPLAAGEADLWPDMATLAKGLAGGVPMGAVLMSPRVAAKVKLNDLGSTFGGGPLACAALLAVLEELERGGWVMHADRLGKAMRGRLVGGVVQTVLGRGCLIGLKTSPPASQVQAALLERGFVTGTSADPHVLRLMPPLNLPLEAVDQLAEALRELR